MINSIGISKIAHDLVTEVLGDEYLIVGTKSGCNNRVLFLTSQSDSRIYVLKEASARSRLSMEAGMLEIVAGGPLATPRAYSNSNVLLTEYVEGYLLGDDSTLLAPPNLPRVARAISLLHAHYVRRTTAPLQMFLRVITPPFFEPDVCTLFNRLYAPDSIPTGPDLWTCVCHNDLHSGNIIFTHNGTAKFIDWEYASIGYNLFDVACLFFEVPGVSCDLSFFPSVETRRSFYREYYQSACASMDLDLADLDLDLVDIHCLYFIPLVAGYWAHWSLGREGFETYTATRRLVAYEGVKYLAGEGKLTDALKKVGFSQFDH
ncbi:putative Ethanolamine kinase [Giardia muris]|uniref:Putative Ethanolamine kinase n=1 Tax=Giardia muris TaxID=5742 RepID=A0A4Z1SQN6_GIAMU|nr:putative Ethanolamine kinase [Giardia muris]|eukprot:TNJ28000.1 putative Ethanolamine kinase [Giardia muris]